VVGEQLVNIAGAEVFLGQLGEHVAVIGGQHEVAAFKQTVRGPSRATCHKPGHRARGPPSTMKQVA